jgi:uncharacterized protein YbaA (DUF1428 family)
MKHVKNFQDFLNEGMWSKSQLSAMSRVPMNARYFLADEDGNVLERDLKTMNSVRAALKYAAKEAADGMVNSSFSDQPYGKIPEFINVHDIKNDSKVVEQYLWDPERKRSSSRFQYNSTINTSKTSDQFFLKGKPITFQHDSTKQKPLRYASSYVRWTGKANEDEHAETSVANEAGMWSKSALAAMYRVPMNARYFLTDEDGNVLERDLKTMNSVASTLRNALKFGKVDKQYFQSQPYGKVPEFVNVHDMKNDSKVVEQYSWDPERKQTSLAYRRIDPIDSSKVSKEFYFKGNPIIFQYDSAKQKNRVATSYPERTDEAANAIEKGDWVLYTYDRDGEPVTVALRVARVTGRGKYVEVFHNGDFQELKMELVKKTYGDFKNGEEVSPRSRFSELRDRFIQSFKK